MTGGGSGPSVSPACARPCSCAGWPASMTSPPRSKAATPIPERCPRPSCRASSRIGSRAARRPRRGQRDRQRELGARAEPRVGRDRLDQPHGDGRRSARSSARRSRMLRTGSRPGGHAPAGPGAASTMQRGRSSVTPIDPYRRPHAAVQVEEPQVEPRPRLDDRPHAWVRRVRRRRAARRGRGCTPWPRARPVPRSCPPAGRADPARAGARPAAAVPAPRGEDARLHHGVLGAAQPGERPSHRARHHARGDVGPSRRAAGARATTRPRRRPRASGTRRPG